MAKEKKNWFLKHWFISIILGLILIGIISGIIGGINGDSEISSPEKNSNEKSSETAIQITARDIYLEYQRNEVGADIKYQGKLLKVNGTITDIGKDLFDNPYIQFMGQYAGVRCNAKDSELQKIGELSKGDFITVQGKGDGFIIDVDIKDCIIIG